MAGSAGLGRQGQARQCCDNSTMLCKVISQHWQAGGGNYNNRINQFTISLSWAEPSNHREAISKYLPMTKCHVPGQMSITNHHILICTLTPCGPSVWSPCSGWELGAIIWYYEQIIIQSLVIGLVTRTDILYNRALFEIHSRWRGIPVVNISSWFFCFEDIVLN